MDIEIFFGGGGGGARGGQISVHRKVLTHISNFFLHYPIRTAFSQTQKLRQFKGWESKSFACQNLEALLFGFFEDRRNFRASSKNLASFWSWGRTYYMLLVDRFITYTNKIGSNKILNWEIEILWRLVAHISNNNVLVQTKFVTCEIFANFFPRLKLEIGIWIRSSATRVLKLIATWHMSVGWRWHGVRVQIQFADWISDRFPCLREGLFVLVSFFLVFSRLLW